MKPCLTAILLCMLFFPAAAQKSQPVSLHIAARANFMAYDRLKYYIHAGAGAGLQLYYNSKRKVKPLFEINADLFSVNKILLVFPDGSTTAPKNAVVTALAGLAYKPVKNFETGIIAGPSFVEGRTYAGIKPFLGISLNRMQSIKATASLTHVFEHDHVSKRNSGFISLGIAAKLF